MGKAKIGPIRQLKFGQETTVTPEFWEMLANLPKFKKVGRITQIT